MEIEAVQELEIETEKVGPQGYSAYEVAVQNGFEGTEEEWLASLKGADGTDGEPGPQGPQGLPGTDGTNATINGVSTINIAAGENITLDQEDGTLTINSTGGGTRDYTALTNKPSINNVTLSGNKSLSDLGAGTYDKPASGIPKTDLASDVQTSLGKADTALQSETYTGTITGITMNGSSKGTSGVVDLGTVITQHQDISGKQDVLTAGTNITIDENNVISATGGANYTAGEGIDITNDTISSTMPVFILDNHSSQNPFIINGCKKGIYFFNNQKYAYLKGYSDTASTNNFEIVDGFIIITDSELDKTVNDYKDVGYIYSTMYEVHAANYVNISAKLRVWQPNGIITIHNTMNYTPFVNPTASATISGTHTYSVLPQSSVVPTNDNQLTNKKYVDDAVASAGSSVPTITITASQIVSQNPLQISMTAEQQAIIEDANVGTLIIDGSALGVNPAYCQKNQDGSTDILLAAFSFAWTGTSGFNISNTTIFAGHYDKQTHILTIVNTPLLGNTPTADNHLANKKYVDDSIAAAITTTLGGSY